MPRTDWGWLVTPDELNSWVIYQDDSLLVIDKPAHLVCHPSKKGPWSSLIGACREWLQSDRLHMVSRLDRETSGVVVMARDQTAASLLQTAMQERADVKTYLAILEGTLQRSTAIHEPVGRDERSSFVARQWVVPNGKPSVTEFIPLRHAGRYTLAEVKPLTGRRHQIRVHAAFMGHPVVGDKLYGPDEKLMASFIEQGFTPELREQLRIDRHALHAQAIAFPALLGAQMFVAPFACELNEFWTGLDET